MKKIFFSMRNQRHPFYVFILGKAYHPTFGFSPWDAGCNDTVPPLT
jgi:hypothetical protein